MLTKSFHYELPNGYIAKNPVSPRDTSKLMVMKKDAASISHHIFYELPDILSNEYVIVLNKSRVFPARLKVRISSKDGECLLIKQIEKNVWQCMVKPGKKFKIGKEIEILGKKANILGTVESTHDDGTRTIAFHINKDLSTWIEDNGYPPFPPYIKNTTADLDDYQTVYAKENGSIAAPTAGLHFTDRVFKQLQEKDIPIAYVTLHVGRGTFLPVKSEHIEDHTMHTEWYSMSKETATLLNKAKKEGKKILAVGTTSVRVLESNMKNGEFHPEARETDIFIYPGYTFKAVDAMLTNFHLPESTLIMLVSAFAGQEFVFKAYQEAIKQKYRFYSFGDAMLIV